MNRPELTSYGLEPEDVAFFEKLDWVCTRTAFGISTVLVLLFLIHVDFGFSWLFSFFLWPAGPIASQAAYQLLARRVSSKLRTYASYKSDVQKYEAWRIQYEAWLTRTQQNFWRSLSGRDFEIEFSKLLQRYFEPQGYQVQLQQGYDDRGIDILVSRATEKIAVQCKARRRPIGVNYARELYASAKDVKATGAILASVSGLTAPARDYCSRNQIRVIDLKDILQMQRSLK
jgi:hypothetical protein